MNRKLLILGAGGHGHVCKEVAEAMQCFDEIEFLDDNSSDAIGRLNEYEVWYKQGFHMAFIGIGNNEQRFLWYERLSQTGFEMINLIHPSAVVSTSAVVGKGTIVEAMAVVNTEARIGRCCIVSVHSVIDHNCEVKDACHVDAGAIVTHSCIVGEFTKVLAGSVINIC